MEIEIQYENQTRLRPPPCPTRPCVLAKFVSVGEAMAFQGSPGTQHGVLMFCRDTHIWDKRHQTLGMTNFHISCCKSKFYFSTYKGGI